MTAGRRDRRVRGAVGLCAALLAAPAAACMPAPHEPSEIPVPGEGCALSYRTSEIGMVGLGVALDLGDGWVSQPVFEGNACHWQARLVVTDCASGRAVVAGPESLSVMDAPGESKIDRFEARVQALPSRTPATVARAAAPLEAGEIAAAGFALEGRPLPLECGCKLHYPGSPGAGGR